MKKLKNVPVTSRGQWDYPGQPTIVPSGNITMKGVNYPVLGMDNTGHVEMMMPGGEYTFPGDYVYEHPVLKNGGEMIRRKDGSYSQRGLWDNIRANKGSGKKPTKEMLAQERKIRAQEKKMGGMIHFAEGGEGDYLPELNSKLDVANFYKSPLAKKYGVTLNPQSGRFEYYIKDPNASVEATPEVAAPAQQQATPPSMEQVNIQKGFDPEFQPEVQPSVVVNPDMQQEMRRRAEREELERLAAEHLEDFRIPEAPPINAKDIPTLPDEVIAASRPTAKKAPVKAAPKAAAPKAAPKVAPAGPVKLNPTQEHYAEMMFQKFGKVILTDKATNRTIYGTKRKDGSWDLNAFEVLTGQNPNHHDVNRNISVHDLEKLKKQRGTPIGVFGLNADDDIYGFPGLHLENSGNVAYHVTYEGPDDKTRKYLYNNNNNQDNYRSYGCINCQKPDLQNLLRFVGNSDANAMVIDSRLSPLQNEQYMKKNNPTTYSKLIKKEGGAVDLNAFYDLPQFVQTNIFQDGGPMTYETITYGPFKGRTFPTTEIPQDQRMVRLNELRIMAKQGLIDRDQRQAMTDSITTFQQTKNPKISGGGGGPKLCPPGSVNVGNGNCRNKDEVHRQAASGYGNMEIGGELPEFQWAGEYYNRNAWVKPVTPVTPPLILTPEQKEIWNKNQSMWGVQESSNAMPPKPVPSTGVPQIDPNLPINKPIATSIAAATTGATAGANAGTTIGSGPTNPTATGQAGAKTQQGVTSMWQQVADHQVFGDKTYRKLNDMATMPLYNPALGMLSDNGLAGFIKMGLGAAAGISGMATGLDNIWRGFKGRKIENSQTGTSPGWQMGKAADPNANMQESIQQEMMRKQQNQVNPPDPAKPKIPIPGMDKLDEMNRTAAYGGTMYKAADGVDLSKKPEFDPTKVKIGQTEYGLDLQGGLNRALGANMGINMFNNTLGYKQAMKSVRENSVKAGMTDYGYQPDDTNWMPMGYDTLNTGPGQTQAPNLYTPVQYAGMQMVSQYEEGGEYDLTEEEIQAILAAGGEIEFM